MKQESKSKLLIAAGVVCLLVAYVLVSSLKGEFGKETAGVKTVDMMPDVIETEEKEEQSSEPKQLKSVITQKNTSPWVIYVTGAVKSPGVYEVKQGARVYEALNAAGGFATNADQEAVNLAAKIQDGEQLRFPTRDETRGSRSSTGSSLGTASNSTATSGTTPNGAANGKSAASGTKTAKSNAKQEVLININTVGHDELVLINGVGPKIAQSILDYRAEHGNFASKEDIKKVRGIGSKKYERIKNQITVGN